MSKQDVSLVILAGGEGVRMGPIGKIIPKPLVGSLNEPLIIRHLRHAKEAGIKNIVISTNNTIYRPIKKCLENWKISDVVLVDNPDHKDGSLPALLRIMNSLKTSKLIMSFVDIFFLDNPYKEFSKTIDSYNYVLGGVSPLDLKELTLGGVLFLNPNKTVKKITELPLKNNADGVLWNGLAYFDTSQRRELKTFLQNNRNNSPEGDFFEYLRQKGTKFNIHIGPKFINVNRPEDALYASLYRYSELHPKSEARYFADKMRKDYLSKYLK